MKQLESLRESAKRRELALRREEEEARKRQLESTKTMTTEKESKTTSVPSTTVESETPYYEGLGLSSSLFSSPEKHDMEILMYVEFDLVYLLTQPSCLSLAIIPTFFSLDIPTQRSKTQVQCTISR